jgi:RimJ/RimL family protein N-acetyltransferase
VEVTFRQLTLSDLPMLREWLQRPHVAQWWGALPSMAEMREDVGPMTLPGARDQAFIASVDGRDIGYIQSYTVKDSGGGWWTDEQDPGARGIDQFLANADELGRGLGTRMVRAFVERLFSDAAVTRVQTDPDPQNPRAIRCYEKAGFRVWKEVETPDGPALLMLCERPAQPLR